MAIFYLPISFIKYIKKSAVVWSELLFFKTVFKLYHCRCLSIRIGSKMFDLLIG